MKTSISFPKEKKKEEKKSNLKYIWYDDMSFFKNYLQMHTYG